MADVADAGYPLWTAEAEQGPAEVHDAPEGTELSHDELLALFETSHGMGPYSGTTAVELAAIETVGAEESALQSWNGLMHIQPGVVMGYSQAMLRTVAVDIEAQDVLFVTHLTDLEQAIADAEIMRVRRESAHQHMDDLDSRPVGSNSSSHKVLDMARAINTRTLRALTKPYKVDKLGTVVSSWPDTVNWISSCRTIISLSCGDLLPVTEHILTPPDIVLSGGGFTLHPQLAAQLTDIVAAMDLRLRRAAQYHSLCSTSFIGQLELKVLMDATGFHLATQNEVVLNWVILLDRLGSVMREMKILCLGDPSRRTRSSTIPRIVLTLPPALRAKIPRSLLDSLAIDMPSLY
ncbi:hypothetical protein C8R46DRAFT_1212327 [Mycena filopes]|nr:hypothetical protein C8R46DRAFT_1212327 [Mycena filopes]